jgi:hypothetical protein
VDGGPGDERVADADDHVLAGEPDERDVREVHILVVGRDRVSVQARRGRLVYDLSHVRDHVLGLGVGVACLAGAVGGQERPHQ